jgi:uncharacterized membrane protein
MPGTILYCGDTHLRSAAAYLAGVLASSGEEFTYVPSDRALATPDLAERPGLVILSDYPAARVSPPLQERLVELVAEGTGLLMIGGWESFHGQGGDWDATPVAECLPVEISPEDDRLNSDRPLLVRRTARHEITRGLPWKRRPPHVGGLNRIRPRDAAEVLLVCDELRCRRKRGGWKFRTRAVHPLLVVGSHGRGRTAALATDLAPHWVGGMVDWGAGRVAAQGPEAEAVEVGDLYAQFTIQLIRWTRGD